jgi:hypothetical protein
MGSSELSNLSLLFATGRMHAACERRLVRQAARQALPAAKTGCDRMRAPFWMHDILSFTRVE